MRWLEKQEIAELFAGTPERRAALERDWNDVVAMVAEMGDPRLRILCQTYLNEYGEKFKRAAAARDYHHARRGGLLEHTAQMMRAGAAMASVYPTLNWGPSSAPVCCSTIAASFGKWIISRKASSVP